MPPTLFADTFYWVAVMSPRDLFACVLLWSCNLGTLRLVATDEVLTEVLNGFCSAAVKAFALELTVMLVRVTNP